ncbi:MAG TPA: MoaD/ThiS family protein [Flavitalea sp.]|nr:MoaD/ThiS family protein [Flavitalea sp.]
MATIIIPTPLRKFTNNTAKLQIPTGTIESSIKELTTNFPQLKRHLLDDNGRIRSFVNIFVGDEDIRDLQQEQTVVKEDTVVSIIPAIAGGTCIFTALQVFP